MTTPRWLHRYAVVTACCTLFLIFVGGLVTSTGSGLAVPDWPLSYGMLMPPMVGGIFYEHGHRMVASAVGLLTVIQAVLLQLREPRRWVRWLGWGAVGAVVLQGVLGGLTVIFLLPPAISVSHATLAQTFLCVVVTLAVVTSRTWQQAVAPVVDGSAPRLRALAVFTTAAIYLQLIVGATMRHLGAGLAVPSFPFATPWASSPGLPPLLPPAEQLLGDAGTFVHMAHRAGALVVSLLALLTLVAALRSVARVRAVRLSGIVLVAGLALQVTLGAFTIWSEKAVVVTTLHVANGALLLATSMILTLLVHRRFAPAPRAA